MKKITILVFVLFFSLFLVSASDAKVASLPAPSNLTTAVVSSSQINLNWQDNSSDETGFKIERSLNGSSFAEIASVGSNIVSFSNFNLAAATDYYYRVRAFKIQGSKTTYSQYSGIASAKTFDSVPAAPTNLSGMSYSSTTPAYIQLFWQDNSINETGFILERSDDGGVTYSEIGTTGVNENYYRDLNAQFWKTYYYRVRAFNSIGSSAFSNTFGIILF